LVSKVAVVNENGKQVGEVELNEELFLAPVKKGAVYYTAVAQQANRRQGTSSTKSRGEVRGSKSKPWPQKGTGRARHGTVRSPLWVGGAVTFGPQPRSFRKKIPRKMKRTALKSVLSSKHQEGKLLVVEELSLEEPKTRRIANLLKNLEINTDTLLVTSGPSPEIIKSTRNLPGVKTLNAHQLNVLDLLDHDYVIFTREALQVVEEVFS